MSASEDQQLADVTSFTAAYASTVELAADLTFSSAECESDDEQVVDSALSSSEYETNNDQFSDSEPSTAESDYSTSDSEPSSAESDYSTSDSESDDEQIANSENSASSCEGKKIYYPGRCPRCRELEDIEPVPMPDDDEYAFSYEDWKDEGLKLRVIRYRRQMALSCGFDVDCSPKVGLVGGIYRRQHFVFAGYDFDGMLDNALQFLIKEYDRIKGTKLESLDVLNATAGRPGDIVFYITFEGVDYSDGSKDTYQAVVSHAILDDRKEILVFRRKSDGQDLFEPDPVYGRDTRLPHTGSLFWLEKKVSTKAGDLGAVEE